MGFCLFENAEVKGYFIAINSSHVEDVTDAGFTTEKIPFCLFKFSLKSLDVRPRVLGSAAECMDLLKQGAKIGVDKVNARAFVGTRAMLHSPLLFNRTDRVVMVREMPPEEFGGRGIKTVTASEVLSVDTSKSIIVERPGTFAARANAQGVVPFLDVRSR